MINNNQLVKESAQNQVLECIISPLNFLPIMLTFVENEVEREEHYGDLLCLWC